MSRRLFEDQFADGVVVGGTRIDKALADTLARFNELPKRDLARRFTQSQFVLSSVPEPGAATVRLPFMTRRNVAAEVSGTVPAAFENEWRTKSVFHSASIDEQYVWTTAIYFRRPAILRQVDVALLTDTVFPNTWLYDAVAPPPGKTASAPVDDFHVLVTADNPWATEDQRMNSLLLRRGDFASTAERISTNAVTPTDFRPNHPEGRAEGVWVQIRDILVPIPRDCRVRAAVVLPHWSSDELPWGAAPWNRQYASVTLTVAEEVEA